MSAEVYVHEIRVIDQDLTKVEGGYMGSFLVNIGARHSPYIIV